MEMGWLFSRSQSRLESTPRDSGSWLFRCGVLRACAHCARGSVLWVSVSTMEHSRSSGHQVRRNCRAPPTAPVRRWRAMQVPSGPF